MTFRIAVVAACIAACTAVAAAQAKPPEAKSAEAKLLIDIALDNLTLQTPLRALSGGQRFSIKGDKGEVLIAGKTISATCVIKGKDHFLGLDANFDGKIDDKELVKLGGDPVVVRLNMAEKGAKQRQDLPIAVAKASLMVRENTIVGCAGAFFAASSLRGPIAGTNIRLIDENLDGKITQDGEDAIAINSQLAMPLLRIHQLGNSFYELAIAEDGKTASAKPVELKLGQIDAPLLTAAGIKGIFMADATQKVAVDLLACKRVGMPAGDYKLIYGSIVSGKDTVTITPAIAATSRTKRPDTADGVYAIGGDAQNVMKLGAPLKLLFQGTFAGDQVGVGTQFAVSGCGGELYHAGGMEKPVVMLLEAQGKQPRMLSKETMEYG